MPWPKTGRLGFKYAKEEGGDVLKKDRNALRAPFGEIDVSNAHVDQDESTPPIPKKTSYGKRNFHFGKYRNRVSKLTISQQQIS